MSKKLNKALSSLFKKKEDTSVQSKQNLDDIFQDSITTDLSSNPADWVLDDFERKETLGTGTFGRVLKAQHKETGQYFAIKTLKKNKVIQLNQIQHCLDEKKLQMEIKCPFTVQVYKTFQDEEKLYLVMDYIPGGEMFTWLRKNKRFSNAVCRFFIAEILLGLEYIHSKGIVYRDLKPENVLIDANGHVKIADFGFAKKITDKTWTMCGTPEYLAPEIILGTGHDKGVDYWSLGVLMYEMLAGYPPFFAKDQMEIYTKIVKGKYVVPSFISPEAKDLLKKLMNFNKSMRYGCLKNGANDIKNHAFFSGFDWDKAAKRLLPSPIQLHLDSEGSSKYFMKYKDSISKNEYPPTYEQQILFKDF
eukprot:gene8740-688_t